MVLWQEFREKALFHEFTGMQYVYHTIWIDIMLFFSLIYAGRSGVSGDGPRKKIVEIRIKFSRTIISSGTQKDLLPSCNEIIPLPSPGSRYFPCHCRCRWGHSRPDQKLSTMEFPGFHRFCTALLRLWYDIFLSNYLDFVHYFFLTFIK